MPHKEPRDWEGAALAFVFFGALLSGLALLVVTIWKEWLS